MSAALGSRRRAERAKPAVVGPVRGPGRALTITVAALILVAMTALMVWAFGYVADAPRFTADAAIGIGERMKAIRAIGDGHWWAPAVVVCVVMLFGDVIVRMAVGLVWRLLPARPRHDWEMPDSELTPEELVERREIEAELDAMEDVEPRRFLLRGSTWFFIGMFVLTAGIPLGADLLMSSPAHGVRMADTGIEMKSIADRCPVLEPDVRAHLERGVPTSGDVDSMRERARVIAASPVRGQECRA